MNTINDNEMLFDFSVTENGYSFEYSIESSLAEANKELEDIDLAIEETIDSIKALTPECDRLDYALAVSSGALCGIIDIFMVAKPGESPLCNITDKWFGDMTERFAKLCGWDGSINDKLPVPDSLHSSIEYLEGKFKIPYDQVFPDGATADVLHMYPKNHHFKSLAHNPSLCGLFFSILDQFIDTDASTYTAHFVSGGELITMDYKGEFELRGNSTPSKLFFAFVNWIGHIISDNSGSSGSKGRGMGIPSPLWTWMNDVTAVKANFKIERTEFEKDFNDFACELFEKGYDARFQAAQSIPVFINEMLVRLMYSLRRFFKYYSATPKEYRSFIGLWKACEPFSNVTVKRMLTVAHGTFCLLDVGDAVGQGFAKGGGYFNVMEFAMRLNLPGLGRFGISLAGEANRGFKVYRLNKEKWSLEGDRLIIVDHIEGLKLLADAYDDEELLKFINDFENSSAYKEAFRKSVELAKKRGVPTERILKDKTDIDNYFMGGNNHG